MRKRMIHPKIWESAYDKSWNSNILVVLLAAISNADDEGIGRISAIKKLTSSLVRANNFTKSLSSLHEEIIIYDDLYYFMPNWCKYQTINKPTQSSFPKPNHILFKELQLKTTGGLPEESRSTTATLPPNRIEVSLKEKKVVLGETLKLFSTFLINENDITRSVIDRAKKLIEDHSFEEVEQIFEQVSKLDPKQRNIAYIEGFFNPKNKSHKQTQKPNLEPQTQWKDLTPTYEEYIRDERK